jgi:hypothetical protein
MSKQIPKGKCGGDQSWFIMRTELSKWAKSTENFTALACQFDVLEGV